MSEICFVIMPFGNGFDDLYEKIYIPAIETVGLQPLRADEIYNNEPIIRDIDHSIREAKIILADVTGRNPNVNYELGAAHALKKEVIIVTAKSEDVPSDYRHMRYIHYDRGGFDWNRKLETDIVKTLRHVLERINDQEARRGAGHRVRKMAESTAEKQKNHLGTEIEQTTTYPETEDTDERDAVIKQAEEMGFRRVYGDYVGQMLRYQDYHVSLSAREGACDEWGMSVAYLLNERVQRMERELPEGHYLRMRSIFFDQYASHGFRVDYIFRQQEFPVLTEQELTARLRKEFAGQLFEPQIRYLAEDVDRSDFSPEDAVYASGDTLPREVKPICFRDGHFVADIDDVYVAKAGHCFYRLHGLLPYGTIQADRYAPGESHWLADWHHEKPRCAAGDTVCFKLKHVYPLADWNHVSNARNINFAELKKQKGI